MVMIIVPLISLIITLILWIIYGKNKKIDIKEEMYPPNINISDAMYVFRKKLCGDALGLMLIELCSKGYIKIVEKQTTTLFNSVSELEVVKLKDYNGDDYNEKAFMDNLFANLDVISYHNTLVILSRMSSKMKYKEFDEKIFCKTPSWVFWLIVLMIIATYFIITYIPISNYGDISSLIICLLFPSIGFTVLFYTITSRQPIDVNTGSIKARRLSAIIFGCVFALIMGAFPIYMFIPMLNGNYLLFYLIGLVCIFIMIFISDRFVKRTDLGNELLAKILGFKMHLENTNINDSNYFYEVLPYIYIFKLQNRYLNKKMNKPKWYEVSEFDMQKLDKLILEIVSAAMKVFPKDIK